ncbi:MAG TPA: archease [Longimicrobiales bacterium]|nr:archease [Longimicrobiales bacterium]
MEGVTALDHTADVGFEVTASAFGELVRRALLAMDWLLREADPPEVAEARVLEVRADDAAGLLRAALREVLLWHELDGFAPAGLEEVRLEEVDGSPAGLVARVHGEVPPEPPVREIKGVTLHGLAAEPRDGGWWGRVIFDV